MKKTAVTHLLATSLLASALLGASTLSHAGTAITTVEATLGGGNGVYMDLQSSSTGFTNQGVTGIWSNYPDPETNAWGFRTAGESTGDGTTANGPGDTSDNAITVFGRSADDKGNPNSEIQVDYTGLTPNASYFFWGVALQNTDNGTSHDLEWGLESGNLTRVVGEPGFQDAAWIAGADFGAGTQLVGVPLGQVTSDADGKLTLYYGKGLAPGNHKNVNRTQSDGVLFEQIVDPHCLLPWAPNATVIANNGSPESLNIPVKNIGDGADLIVTGASVTGTDGIFFTLDGAQFPMTLAPNAEGVITVQFDPQANVGNLASNNVLEVLSNHGGTVGTVVTTPISGSVRNPWISTLGEVVVGPIAVNPGTTSFTVDVSNLGFDRDLEVSGATLTGTDAAMFTVDTDFTAPLIVAAGASGTLTVSFDSGAVEGTYTANLEIASDDSVVSTHIVKLTVTVSASVPPVLPIQLAVTGYDAGTGILSLTATNIPDGQTFHFEKSSDLETFTPLSPVFDFDSNTAQPFAIPVDTATDPALFFQVFNGATTP